MGNTSWIPQLEEWTKIEPGLILGFILFISLIIVDGIDACLFCCNWCIEVRLANA